MNTTTSRRITRLVAGPIAAAGIIAGALGGAALANADTPLPSPHRIPVSPDTSGIPDMSGMAGMVAEMALMPQMEAQMQQAAAAMNQQKDTVNSVKSVQHPSTKLRKHTP